MITGVRIALDVGSVRIGVAKCDRDGLLATPLTTIPAGTKAIQTLLDLIQEHDAICVYVGKPVSLAGRDTTSTLLAIDFARELKSALNQSTIQVRLIDER